MSIVAKDYNKNKQLDFESRNKLVLKKLSQINVMKKEEKKQNVEKQIKLKDQLKNLVLSQTNIDRKKQRNQILGISQNLNTISTSQSLIISKDQTPNANIKFLEQVITIPNINLNRSFNYHDIRQFSNKSQTIGDQQLNSKSLQRQLEFINKIQEKRKKRQEEELVQQQQKSQLIQKSRQIILSSLSKPEDEDSSDEEYYKKRKKNKKQSQLNCPLFTD